MPPPNGTIPKRDELAKKPPHMRGLLLCPDCLIIDRCTINDNTVSVFGREGPLNIDQSEDFAKPARTKTSFEVNAYAKDDATIVGTYVINRL